MGLAEELIAVKMRLQGAASYQREMQRSTAVTTEYGAAAERAGAQAKSGAVGIDAMTASSSKGMGALTSMKNAGAGMKKVGGQMTSAFTVPFALIAGVGVKTALDFSDAMEQITTQAGASQREVNLMSKSVMAYAESGKSTHGPNALAEGLFFIESAGFRGKRAMDAMVKSEQLATVGHADLGKTSKTVAAAMATQIKGTQNLTETVGIMNATVGIGSMRFEDLLSAMGTGLLDRAANLGLSLKEVGAALGTMTTVGQPAAASATRIGMAFNMMAAPTDKAKEAMKGIALGATDLAMSMRKRGLIPTLELLKGHLDKTFGTDTKGLVKQSAAISEMFGGGRTSGGIVALMRHIDLLKSKFGELGGDIKSKFALALERSLNEPLGKLHVAGAKLSAQGIRLGTKLIPIVTKVADLIVSVAKWVGGLPGPVKSFLLVAAGVLAVLGPLLSGAGLLVIGLEGLAGAVTWLAGTFAALDISMAGIPLLIGAVAAVAVGLSGIFSSSASKGNALADTSKRLAQYMSAQRTAGKNLVASEHSLISSKQRQRQATHNFKGAQADLNAVVNEYGRKSRPAIHAEQMLASKRWSLLRATKALKTAEREHGIALQMTKQLTRSAVLEARHEINQLKTKKTQFDELFTTEKNRGAGLGRLNQISEWGTHVNDRLQSAHKKLNETLLEASQKIGPAYSQWLQKATGQMLQFGSEMGVVNSQFKKGIELSEHLNEILGQEPRHGLAQPNPFKSPGTKHKGISNTGGAGGPSTATVSVVHTRMGPSTARLNTGRQGHAGRGRAATPVHVHATFNVNKRKFGEAFAMAMIDDEANS
jgi:TP901 family phage tail tape measure protein